MVVTGNNGHARPETGGHAADDRNRRFEIFSQADAEPLHLLAEAVLGEVGDLPVDVTSPPRPGVLMLRMREPVHGVVFNAGEVLVTEAAVTVGGEPGHGVRLGRAPETALAAAILDAALAAGHPLAPRIIALLDEQAAVIAGRDAQSWQAVASTRVEFEEMHQ